MNRLIFTSLVNDKSGENITIDKLSAEEANIKVTSTKKTGIGSQIVINLLISFNLFCAIGMCYELFALRSERTLKRSLTTGNRPSMVIGGIFGAQFIMIMIGYIALLFVYTFLNDRTLLAQTPIIILNLMMTTAVALSLAVCVVRVIKDEKLIGIVMQIILVGTCFVGGSFVPVEMLPKSITFFSKITPQYWAIQSIKEGRFEFSLIVLLFAALLFTAGTVSTRSFAE
jgi:ABC-2 type transport system permease protein